MKKVWKCVLEMSFGSLIVMFLSSEVIMDFLVTSVRLATWWKLTLVIYGFYLIYTSTIQLVTNDQSMKEDI